MSKKYLVLQLYALIVAAYLFIFPSLNYYLSAAGTRPENYHLYQLIFLIAFFCPMLIMAYSFVRTRSYRTIGRLPGYELKLSRTLPILLLLMLTTFWYVAIEHDLLIRRIGHEALQENSASVNTFLLYIYRITVETSFFVVLVFRIILSDISPNHKSRKLYHFTLNLFLISFLGYFLLNSRMQFIMLCICLYLTSNSSEQLSNVSVKKIIFVGIALIFTVLSLTVLREVFTEQNGRFYMDDIGSFLVSLLALIAGRMDSLSVIYQIDSHGFDPFIFDLSGIEYFFNFIISFFTDPDEYQNIKASLVTSPSVYMTNKYLITKQVDFPKSMVLDMFLTAGIWGLMVNSVILSMIVGFIQSRFTQAKTYSYSVLIGLYMLPLALEFEKEFLGFILGLFKWSLVLLLFLIFRPVAVRGDRNAALRMG